MGCDDKKLSKYLTHTFMAHCHTMICQQVTLSGEAEWPKVADAVIEAQYPLSGLGGQVTIDSFLGSYQVCLRGSISRVPAGSP